MLSAIVWSLHLAVWGLLLLATAHLLRLGIWALRTPLLPVGQTTLPRPLDVTVQLPIRNERHVAERVIRSACGLVWNQGRLQVQVLDDSDPEDETSALVDRVVAELSAQGHCVQVLRRGDRKGFKAGNLEYGLAQARGELIVVLDADCQVERDLLVLMAPSLLQEGVCFVQGRWVFDNEEQSLLTRLQGMILSGLMAIEQDYLSRQGLPVSFNGSGGMWKRESLVAAGGFLPSGRASIAEDLDLSYRAELGGQRGKTLPRIAITTELPRTMAAFRIQQKRWVRGGAQVLRSLYRRLAQRPDQGGVSHLAMLGHLVRHARQPLLGLLPVFVPLTSLGLLPMEPPPYVWLTLLLGLCLAIGVYYGAARRRLGLSMVRAFGLAPVLIALSVGLSFALTQSLLLGLFGTREAEFVRTPKVGAGGGTLRSYRVPWDPLALLEVALGAAQLAAAGILLGRGEYLAALGIGGFLGVGLLYVGVSSLVR